MSLVLSSANSIRSLSVCAPKVALGFMTLYDFFYRLCDMAVREALVAAWPGELLASVAAAPAATELEVRLGVVS